MAVSAEQCADWILETVPLITRSLRAEVTHKVGAGITLPQFRVLSHLDRGKWCLSDLAAHQKVSLATMSKLVSGLVERGLVERSYENQDRRYMTLSLTPKGKQFYGETYGYTHRRIADRVVALSSKDRAAVIAGLKLLRPIFESDGERELSAK